MQVLIINGVDVTPYITKEGYKTTIEDLDRSAERSMAGTLTRDRVARVPKIEVTIKHGLGDYQVSRIINALKPARFQATFYNPETGTMTTTNFYRKINYPSIYTTRTGQPQYTSWTFSLIGYGGI